jgi:hypothetical protein
MAEAVSSPIQEATSGLGSCTLRELMTTSAYELAVGGKLALRPLIRANVQV